MRTRKRGLQGEAPDASRGADEHPLAGREGRDDQALIVPLDRLRPDPGQPRKIFDEAALAELAESVREHGVLQPLLAHQKGDLYYIIAGERRYRAAGLAGLSVVPVKLLGDEKRIREVQLVENLQREDLGLMDEARALGELQKTLATTVRGLEQATGKSKSYIARRLALLKVPGDVQAMLERAPGLFTQAEAVAKIADGKRRQARIAALLQEPSAASGLADGKPPGRPVRPFTFKKRRSGAFDLVVKFRPGESDRTQLVAQLRKALAELED